MKKHLLTLALGLMMGSSAFAQVEFVDAQGNIIPDGSTVVRNEIEKPVPVLEMYQINSGISVKNTSSAAVSNITTQLDVTDLPFGALPLCFPETCWITIGNFTGDYPTHKPSGNGLAADGPWTSPAAGSLAAPGTKDGNGNPLDIMSLQTEWKLNSLGQSTFDKDKDKGEFTATYSVLVNGKTVSTIKVLYTTDQNATGIANIKNDAASQKEVGRYTINGQKLAQGAKCLAIVKYADGSAKKVVVK